MAHTKRQEALIKRYALKGVNKPKLTPKHKTKKAVVLAKTGDHKIKLIRFGDQKSGHNYSAGQDKHLKVVMQRI